MTPPGSLKVGADLSLNFLTPAKEFHQRLAYFPLHFNTLPKPKPSLPQHHKSPANMPVSKKMKASPPSYPSKICSLLTSYHRSNATTRKQRQQALAPPSKPTVCQLKPPSRHLSYVPERAPTYPYPYL
jgi:hypothetical protein